MASHWRRTRRAAQTTLAVRRRPRAGEDRRVDVRGAGDARRDDVYAREGRPSARPRRRDVRSRRGDTQARGEGRPLWRRLR